MAMHSEVIEFHDSGRRTRLIAGDGARRSFLSTDDFATADGVYVIHDAKLGAEARELVHGRADAVLIEAEGGESQKTLGTVETLLLRLAEAGANRKSLIVVLGGGTLTDLGAFTAAVYMRGVRTVLLPTTVLAMVDAAIGGKCGVDLGGLKNFAGVIRQPAATVIDPELLSTLPDRPFREGFVEAVKTAAMLDQQAFLAIEAALPKIVDRDPDAVFQAILLSARLKLRLVREDETETGRRMLLNYGHTVGHAIETLSGFEITHGEAVAIGMNVESLMSGFDAVARIAAATARLLPGLRPPSPQVAAALWNLMTRDKKASSGRVRIAVPKAIGEGVVIETTEADLERALLP